ncbi:MAG: ribonuclease R [Clostridia bacterium]|nr:ribonuclease R [Clostridia bacterium]
MILKDELLKKFISGEAENLGVKRICELFEAKSQFEKTAIRNAIAELESEGRIVYTNGRFVKFENSGLFKGVVKGNERGFAFVVTENGGDFFVPSKNLHNALHGDTVIIEKVKSLRGSSDEAEVKKILKRGIKTLVGTYQAENGFGFIVPDDKNYYVDVYVPFKKSRGAKSGDKVVCEITEYPEVRRNPEGKILEILGKRFDLKAEELSIIKAYNLPLDFEEPVKRELELISDSVSESELAGRTDFTSDFVVTIDGEDSRDFDDAVCVKKVGSGYKLYVHIADVSHYVKFYSEIGKEAFARSTSVYFPERVIPMLPKKLSNGICSLNEGELRLTLSVIMDINSQGVVTSFDIVNGYIRSKKRLTYTTVQSIIDGDSEVLSENEEVTKNVTLMYELSKLLTKKREERGNIDLSVKESHITVDEKGNISVEPRKSAEAYKIIEEFMILANETVAEYVFYLNLPFIYRVHEKPDREKVEGFKTFLKALNIFVKWNGDTCHPKDYQTLLESLKGKPLFNVVNKVMLRSMQKAKYTPENVGHFGLSSKCYCHFTSPIRRYPDLVIHAIVKDILSGNDVIKRFSTFVSDASIVSSQNERRADEAERAMDDLYKCRFMKKHVGKEYHGVISGVTGFGVFVELENTVEGLIKLEYLPRGSYALDEGGYTLRSGKRSFTLGDEVWVKVMGVDMRSRRIDMALIAHKNNK